MHRFVFTLLLTGLAFWGVQAEERETLGPSNRRTAIVISEVMYHPLEAEHGQNLEFLELYNAGIQPASLTGWQSMTLRSILSNTVSGTGSKRIGDSIGIGAS